MRWFVVLILCFSVISSWAFAEERLSRDLLKRVEDYKAQQISIRDVFGKNITTSDLISLTYINEDQSSAERNIISNALHKLSYKAADKIDQRILGQHVNHFRALANGDNGIRAYKNARILLLKLNAAGDKEAEYIFDFFDQRSTSYYSFAEWMKDDATYLKHLLNHKDKAQIICEGLNKTISEHTKFSLFLVEQTVDVFLEFVNSSGSCRQQYIETYLEYKKWVDDHRNVEPDAEITLFDYYSKAEIDEFLDAYKSSACKLPLNDKVKSWSYVFKAHYGYIGENDEKDVRTLRCT